jgi:hypothetical protein
MHKIAVKNLYTLPIDKNAALLARARAAKNNACYLIRG